MKKNEYGSANGRYGRTDCSYCDGKDIKRDNMGNHLMKFHKDKLNENFSAYINMPNWNQPFVNVHSKTYSLCFVCGVCHGTTCKSASKPAIKHMTGKCSYENQYKKLKEFCESKSSNVIVPVIVAPTQETHTGIQDVCPTHAEEISNLKAEIAKIKEEIINFMKNNIPVLPHEIPEVCTDCKEWGDAYSDKTKEVDELKEKLGIN